MTEIGGPQVGIHRTSFVLHGSNRQLLIGKLTACMLLKTLIDRPVDRLLRVTDQALPGGATGRRQFLFRNAFLFQTFSELGLPAAFLSVALVTLPEFLIEAAIVLAV